MNRKVGYGNKRRMEIRKKTFALFQRNAGQRTKVTINRKCQGVFQA